MTSKSDHTGLGRKIAIGAVWMVLFKLADRTIGLLSTMVLARLLMPQDFGLVAMAMLIIGMLELLGFFSFDLVLIQKQKVEAYHYNTAWTFNVLFGLCAMLILILLALPAANFYDEPRLQDVMTFLSLGLLIQGLENIGVVAFRKELQFNKEFNFMLAKKVVGFAVVVPLAFILQNYWALIIGMLVSRMFGVAYSYWVHPYRPWFSFQAAHELFHFSKWLLFNHILSFVRLRIGDFIIGKIAGTHVLGLYTVAFEISNLPTTELVGAVSRATFPGYAKMAHDMEVLRQGVINVSSLIVIFALPAGVGVALTADPLVRVILGDKWLEAIPLIQILGFYGTVISLQTNVSYVYLAMGKPYIATCLSAAYLAVLIPLVIWLSLEQGVMGAAWGYLGVALLFLPITFAILFIKLQIRPARWFSAVWRSVIAAGVMLAVLELSISPAAFAPGLLGDVAELFLTAGLGLIVYSASLFGLWHVSHRPFGAEQIILEKLMPKLGLKFG